MSKDRPVATDALDTLGTAPIPDDSGRDAIHLAVEPVIAAERLLPGERVGFVDGGVGRCSDPVGIVDPFIIGHVAPGQKFWLIIPPRQITSLRHVWSHPAFPDDAPTAPDLVSAKKASEDWIRSYVARTNAPDFFTLMARATAFCEGDTGWDEEYLHFNGVDAHGEIEPDFWRHFEIVTGLKPGGQTPTYFSCSC